MDTFDRDRLIHVLKQENLPPKVALGPNIVIFGASGLGVNTYKGLTKIGIEPVAFCDNDERKHGQTIEGKPIMSPEGAVREFGTEVTYIAAIWSGHFAGYHFDTIKKQLHKLNCKNVINFPHLYNAFEDVFLPYYSMDRMNRMLEQKDEILEAYDLMSDTMSQELFVRQVCWRKTLDDWYFDEPIKEDPYFCNDLYLYKDNEVFVDCGAYTGDTIMDYLAVKGDCFSRIVAFEPDESNFIQLKGYVDTLEERIKRKIEIHRAGVGDKNEVVRFSSNGELDSFVCQDGEVEISCVRLDDHLKGVNPTVIKMDIEGYEQKALMGSRNIISSNSPLLSICVYHRQSDLWRVPLLIHEMNRSYKLHIRQHLHQCWDTVCYAIPNDRK